MRRKRQGHRRAPQSTSCSRSDPSNTASRPKGSVRVFIADAHEVVRVGVCALLEAEQDLEVVGQADTVAAMISELPRTKPDIILSGFGLSDGSESDLFKEVLHVLPSVRIISLMRDDNATAFRHAVEAGVQGFIRESTDRIQLISAIRAVAKGNSYLCPDDADRTFRLLRQQQESAFTRSGLHSLSPQEQRVIALIAKGKTNKEIATKLALSDKTVKNYIGNMFTKLEIGRRTEAVALYLKAQSFDEELNLFSSVSE